MIKRRGFAAALITTTVREQHIRSHNKGATSVQALPVASSSVSLPTRLDIPKEIDGGEEKIQNEFGDS